MEDFLQPVVDFFGFVGSVLSTIVQGIDGLTNILTSVIELILSVTRILPNPLYPCLLTFLGVYSTIFIYKILRANYQKLN